MAERSSRQSSRTDRSNLTVKLPVMAVRTEQPAYTQLGRHRKRASSHSLSVESMPSLAGLKILAVDDEPDARFLLNAVLEQCGADVRTRRRPLRRWT